MTLLAVLCGGQQALSSQAPTATPSQQATPGGKVLFERHTPPATDSPATPDAAPAGETLPTDAKAGTPGVSSSTRRSRTTLHRRSPRGAPEQPDAIAPESQPESAAPKEAPTASSSMDDAVSGEHPEPILLTAADAEAARRVTAQERSSVTIAAEDLDLHLDAHTGKAEVRAQLVLRNSGADPLKQIPLRISGALLWQSVRVGGSAVPLPVRQYGIADDLDHTGVARELSVALQEPLLPGATVSLDLYYGGTLSASTQRLTALGAPPGRAALTDWDTVTDTFTGLRGLGSVLWYPVAGAPASLRDGTAVTDAVERSRTANAPAGFKLRLTLQYEGSRPAEAFFCGERQPLIPMTSRAEDESGFVTASWTRRQLGPHTPSLFASSGTAREMANGLLNVTGAAGDAANPTGEAAARVRPMLSEWLGAAPQRPLTILDLPVPGAAGFADGALLVAPLTADKPAALAPELVQPLASAWLPASITAPWLRDGLPAFLQAVWIERTAGRTSALSALASSFHNLSVQAATTEPSGISSSQPTEPVAATVDPLATCADPLCARARAAYVFEMLRGMLGDAALQQAISGWAVQQAQSPGRSPAEETAGMKDLLQRVAGKRDLAWFFANWIDADRGLPELTIVTVAPRRVERASPTNFLPQARRPVAGPIGAEPVAPTDPRDMSERDAEALAAANGGGAGPAPGSWLVAVEVQNNGAAEAEVPVTVRSGGLTNTLPLRIAGHSRATVRVPFEADPQEVLVNDGSVPEVRTAMHRRSIGSLPAAH